MVGTSRHGVEGMSAPSFEAHHAISYAGRRDALSLISFFCITLAAGLHAGELAPGLSHIAARSDTICRVWVIFRDKPAGSPRKTISSRALTRRARAGFPDRSYQDIAVSEQYLRNVEAVGAVRRHTFSWANAASFSVKASELRRVAAVEGVKRVIPVRSSAGSGSPPPGKGLGKTTREYSAYGPNEPFMGMLEIPAAHRLIAERKELPGSGIVIGFFDTGFDLSNRCFEFIRSRGAVLADSDFVDRDGDVDDFADHGTRTLSLVAGYDPGRFMGIAWGATFVLARTEDDRDEYHAEEDNWAAALVWAEGLGVTIVNSSLGYLDGFTDEDYTFEDLDGKTTIISRAAAGGVARGLIIVNSVGNEGSRGVSSLGAPADVEGLIAAGSVHADSTIAGFSSRGPAANGKIVPDLVAPGTGITAADTTFDLYVGHQQGTSFSAPFVTGVAALIAQSHRGSTPQRQRDYLFSSCYLLPRQGGIDNTYGRGLPNAYHACMMDSSDVYFQIRDSLRMPVGSAVVVDRRGSPVSVTDNAGVARVSFAGITPPDTVFLSFGSGDRGPPIAIPSVPSRVNLTVKSFRADILVRDTSNAGDRPVPNGEVWWRVADRGEFRQSKTDSRGRSVIYYYSQGQYEIYAQAAGFLRSDTLRLELSSAPDTILVVLTPRRADRFLVYPSVVSISGPDPRVYFDFSANPDDPRAYNQLARMSVRTADGRLVWSHAEYLEEFRIPTVIYWDCRNPQGRPAIPGVYLFVLEYAGKTRRTTILLRK